MESSSQWIFYLTIASMFGAAVVRTLVVYWGSPARGQILGLLSIWLILFILETTISFKQSLSRSLRGHFSVYLVLQLSLTFVLLTRPDFTDYLAILYAILSMQVIQQFSLRVAAFWIGLFTLLIILALTKTYGLSQSIALALVFTALNIFLASYSLTNRRTQAARLENQVFVQELQEKSRQLQAYARQLEQLAVEQERHRLARELHDSVTQTIFSMTLTTQSAMLLLDRYPSKVNDLRLVGRQLDRLYALAQSALSEMQVLITELRPAKMPEVNLVAELRQHLASRQLLEKLSVSLEVEGDETMSSAEQQGLFRIIQEALNNVMKHSQVSQATIRLHLLDPCWVEVIDWGQGFDVHQVLGSRSTRDHLGLRSMMERADEIGWNLQILSSPGAGTRIRIEKPKNARQV